MADAVFPYPGGKSRFASWIIDLLPEHRCYVEVFGGAAGVLFNKEPSKVEAYNDLDGDLVQFFEVLRDRHEELVEWLETVPYSRAIHDLWAEWFYCGYRPSDPIERAGQFFFLRYAQWGAKYDAKNGFATAKTSSKALSYSNKIERLDEFAERFDDVVIENLDWSVIFERYDDPETVFYCDPPYVGSEGYYLVDDIDHEALAEELDELEGYWIVSYDEIPDELEGEHVEGRDATRMMGSGKAGGGKDAGENLIMNYRPEGSQKAR